MDRKTAEAARCRVIAIDLLPATPELATERGILLQVWNSFCAAEQRRLDAADRARRDPKIQVHEFYRKMGWS